VVYTFTASRGIVISIHILKVAAVDKHWGRHGQAVSPEQWS
jgi:hypothetical protein